MDERAAEEFVRRGRRRKRLAYAGGALAFLALAVVIEVVYFTTTSGMPSGGSSPIKPGAGVTAYFYGPLAFVVACVLAWKAFSAPTGEDRDS